MKRVLLTGGSGFIGRHCIPYLLSLGYEVYATCQTRRPEINSPGLHLIEIDLLDGQQVAEILEKIRPSHLLHLAWYVSPGKFWASTLNIEWLKSSLILLENFAKNGGKRVVMAGTCFEYEHEKGILSENNTPLKPLTLYGSSKLSLSQALEGYSRQMGLSWSWARIFFLYGPHEYPQRFIPTVIKGLLEKKEVPCTHCEQVRDFMHVDDVGNCFATLLDSQVEGPINIASGEGVSMRTIIAHIEEHLQVKGLMQFGAVQPQAFEPSHIIGNNERLRSELKWSPLLKLQEGIIETIQWWR